MIDIKPETFPISNNTHKGKPNLVIQCNAWSLLDEGDHRTSEKSLRRHLELIKEAGFDAYSTWTGDCQPYLTKALLDEYGIRHGGAFWTISEDELPEIISGFLELGDGPINCMLAGHNTPVEEATRLLLAINREAKKLGAQVYVETHRGNCTETPEKTEAMIHNYHAMTGEWPLINHDFSHHALVKHMAPDVLVERLLTPEIVPCFQHSQLWHMRPFNGQHIQIPITDGKGNFSPEYQAIRPFIRTALQTWLDGPRPGNELWVTPEQGTDQGYQLSCMPPVWDELVVLGNDIKAIWDELTADL